MERGKRLRGVEREKRLRGCGERETIKRVWRDGRKKRGGVGIRGSQKALSTNKQLWRGAIVADFVTFNASNGRNNMSAYNRYRYRYRVKG